MAILPLADTGSEKWQYNEATQWIWVAILPLADTGSEAHAKPLTYDEIVAILPLADTGSEARFMYGV